MAKQQTFFTSNGKHKDSFGGILRRQRKGRGQRPLSTRESLHVVFKLDQSRLRKKSLRAPQVFGLTQKIIQKYARRFFIQVEQISIQHNHIHLLIRTQRRSLFHYFFRVTAGQMAQQFEKRGFLNQSSLMKQQSVTDTPNSVNTLNALINQNSRTKKQALWIYRPFSRVVRGIRGYQIVKKYIQLNELEVTGAVKYRKERLKGCFKRPIPHFKEVDKGRAESS